MLQKAIISIVLAACGVRCQTIPIFHNCLRCKSSDHEVKALHLAQAIFVSYSLALAAHKEENWHGDGS